MKYGELFKKEAMDKLMLVCFNTPAKNLSVYRFCNAIKPLLEYTENERVKLIQKYGTQQGEEKIVVTNENLPAFAKDYNDVLNQEIIDEIPDIGITENDFGDNCVYPQDKTTWLSPAEMASVLEVANKLKKNND